MAAREEEEADRPGLPELFARGQELLEELEAERTLPSGSQLVQDKVREGLELLERAADMLAQLDVFGRDEDVEELSSGDLKFLLVPALQGALTLRLVEPAMRRQHLGQAREHFRLFLSRCHGYHVTGCPPPPPPVDASGPPEATSGLPLSPSGPPATDLMAMVVRRQAKIERFRRKQEAERRLAALREAVSSGHADDERMREFHLLSVQRWVLISLEELDSIDQELRILDWGAAPEPTSASASAPAQPAKPFVLMRSAAQAKVFGEGYPSLATMTVSEWYEQQQQRCNAVPGQHGTQAPEQEGPKAAAEEKEDDEHTLHQAQEWDDWKDTHPRGYGNRQNMG